MVLHQHHPPSFYLFLRYSSAMDKWGNFKLRRERLLLFIEVDLAYRATSSCDILLQIEAAENNLQLVMEEKLDITDGQLLSRSNSDESIGDRIWLHIKDEFKCTYQVKIEIQRSATNLSSLKQTPLANVRGDDIKYLMASRYCHLGKFEDSIPSQFSTLKGGELVVGLSDWIKNEFTYTAGASDAFTTAHDTLKLKKGICRDYAHVLISMLRLSAIPARMVSAYAPSVSPSDFHALVEVYLEGAWHLIDPTGMTTPDEIAIIGVGRDAADISFLTSYGFLELQVQSVIVSKLD